MENFTIDRSKHIENVIDNFDFNKVEEIMKCMNWKWFSFKEKEYYTPEIEDLKKVARDLMESLFPIQHFTSISSGGFKATKHEDFLELEFILTEYDSSLLNSGSEYERLKKSKDRRKKLKSLNI